MTLPYKFLNEDDMCLRFFSLHPSPFAVFLSNRRGEGSGWRSGILPRAERLLPLPSLQSSLQLLCHEGEEGALPLLLCSLQQVTLMSFSEILPVQTLYWLPERSQVAKRKLATPPKMP